MEEVLSRSICTFTVGLVICRSLFTSMNAGRPRIFASRIGAQWYNSSVSASCNVYWYSLLVTLPPMRIGGMFCRYTFMPGIEVSFGRHSWMMASAGSLSLRGFRRMKMRPRFKGLLEPDHDGPMNAMAASTFGSSCTIFAACLCFAAMASKEISCAASVKTSNCPVSVLGRKPFGMAENSHAVAAKIAKNTNMGNQLYLMDHFSVAS